jgi:hypothetical protein
VREGVNPKIASLFERYGGRRLDVADNQPIESGFSARDLMRELARLERMLAHNLRIETSQTLTERERASIQEQAARYRRELQRRGQK